MLIYNKYQRYFTNRNALTAAVIAGNLFAVQTLLHQTDPVVCDRDDKLLVDAIYGGSFPVLKYLMDSGLFNIEGIWNGKVVLNSFATVNNFPVFVRDMMDAVNVPQELVDHAKLHAPKYNAIKLLTSGDQQLIKEFLYKDGVKQFKTPISSAMMIANALATSIQQLEHFERLFDITDPAAQNIQAQKQLDDSHESARLILASHATPDQHDNNNNNNNIVIDNDQCLRIAKILTMPIEWKDEHLDSVYREYIITGDCMLIPLLLDHRRDNSCERVINRIIKHGTLTQAIVAMKYMDRSGLDNRHFGGILHSFMSADDMSRSFEIVKYLDGEKVMFKYTNGSCVIIRAFTGTTEMLEFILAANIFKTNTGDKRARLDLLDAEHVKLILPTLSDRNGPHRLSNQLRIATFHARMDTLNLLLDHVNALKNGDQTIVYTMPHTYAFNKAGPHGLHREVIKLLVEKAGLTPLQDIFHLIGKLGDTELLDYGLTHFFGKQLNANKLPTMIGKQLNATIHAAIKLHNMDYVIHVFTHHKDKMLEKNATSKTHHILAVSCSNLEMLECLLRVDPIERLGQADELFGAAISHGHIEVLDWLIEHLEEYRAQFLASPIIIKPLIESHLIAMLQHLLDIGAKFDLRNIHNLRSYKSNQRAQSIVQQFKAKTVVEPKSKGTLSLKRDSSSTDNTSTASQQQQQPNKRGRKK
ncbi:hypothetical protein SAMD00019534_091410 [Acytostelium subglobosum LB1]|uniref:hypothetical protein n=1 Tax=Acytostelium subglobosum LB1 TaxID=1410327 RepID=UPI000644F590|nr:hypothetical protein SAMD00019534_091410 [Acytostelium subglobosum LB1]GAM25966.1 hypothetical protein SAMD00019534_091410 [Acytostelium subglobosum LB1]|eukprot:XP_012751009.1 hypothetical protein SAMD00019534_091410 [Acytostelium subglobosum LB1]